MSLFGKVRKAWNGRYMGPGFGRSEWVVGSDHGGLSQFTNNESLTEEEAQRYHEADMATARQMLAERAGDLAVQTTGDADLHPVHSPDEEQSKPHLYIVPDIDG